MAILTDDNRSGAKPPLYVFFHVSKTGGTSFTNHLAELYCDQPEAIAMLNSHQQQLAMTSGTTYWTEKPLAEQLRAMHVAGHSASLQAVAPLLPWKQLEFLTLFREPTSRFISVFNYLIHQRLIPQNLTPLEFFNPSFPDQCQITFLFKHFLNWSPASLDSIHDPQHLEFFLDAACRALDIFRFIGLYEQYSDHMAALMDYLTLPSNQQQCLVTGRDIARRVDHSDELESHLRTLYPIEYRFFERVQEKIYTNGSPFFAGNGQWPNVPIFKEKQIAT